MNARLRVWFGWFIIIAVCAAIGVSLTKTEGMDSASGPSFGFGGALIGAVGMAIFRTSREGIVRSLPPAEKLRGLKVFLAGFCLALVGWLVAVFLNEEVGILGVFAGVVVGGIGMAMHFYVWSKRDA